VSSESLTLAEQGLAAWRRGDFETLERLLDTAVEWRWVDPGDWDCHGREEVLRTLRERYAQGFAAGALEFRDIDPDTVIVVSHPSEIGGPDWPAETATVMRFRDGKVVSMQDYRTEPEAVAAVTAT
jgi:ketosteroid isomerase-like protein